MNDNDLKESVIQDGLAKQVEESVMEKVLARLEDVEEELKTTKMKAANLTSEVRTKSGKMELKRNRKTMTNEEVRGLANATGGAAHPDHEDGTPWTPAHPDWVIESYMSGGQPTEKSELAIHLYKQSYLDGRRFTNYEMLNEAMIAYEEGRVLEYAPAGDIEALAAEAMGNV